MSIRKCPTCGGEFRKGALVTVATRTRSGSVMFRGKTVCGRCARSGLTVVIPVGSDEPRAVEAVRAVERPLGKRERQALLKDVIERVRAQLRGLKEVVAADVNDDEQSAFVAGKVDAYECVLDMLKGDA